MNGSTGLTRGSVLALTISFSLPLFLAVGSAAAPTGERDHHGNLLTPEGDHVHTNALIFESSPYLQQHAHNPVDWLPWGERAFQKARTEGKPIFLSIGYSTCHWCHVMARESFSDEQVAAVLNEHFVPVKVDREERPDVDDVYMTAVNLMRGRGGWPLSAWLTPGLEPFEGGTYFPKEHFLSILESIHAAWQSDQEQVRSRAEQVAAAVRQRMQRTRRARELGDDVLEEVVPRLLSGVDEVHGGWGLPKFPRESTILFLLETWQRERHDRTREVALKALEGMRSGGIHDQVGGGFARYSTDARWLVPHFEKMLYNQAWMGRGYLEAWRVTGDERHRRTVEGILEYVSRDMTAPGGGFYSAEDADSEGEEGLFYLWTLEQLEEVLGAEEAARAAHWFGVTKEGNFPEQPGKSILTARHDASELAKAQGTSGAELLERVDRWREKLVAAREKRVRPERDDKVLADWNGMMIGTFARAGRVLGDEGHVEVARRAAEFVLEHLRDARGRLLHAWHDGHASVPGFLEDHAALADGLVELFDATGEQRWLEEARALYAAAREQMRDPEDGAFWRTGPRHEELIARAKDAHDGATPSGNSLIAWDAVRLWRRTGDESYRTDAEGVVSAFATELASGSSAFMLRALAALRHGETGALAFDDGGVVRLATDSAPLSASPGAVITLPLRLRLKEGWHVMAGPPVPDGLSPTRVVAAHPLAVGEVDYPEGRSVQLAFIEDPVRLYEREEVVRARLRVPEDVPVGAAVSHVDVRVQACDDARCLKPATLRLEAPLHVTAPAPRPGGESTSAATAVAPGDEAPALHGAPAPMAHGDR